MTSHWYFTPGGIPFHIDPLPWGMTMPCKVPVVPGGDGAEYLPLAERTARCRHRTDFMVGMAPTCGHHLIVAARIAGIHLVELPPECRP